MVSDYNKLPAGPYLIQAAPPEIQPRRIIIRPQVICGTTRDPRGQLSRHADIHRISEHSGAALASGENVRTAPRARPQAGWLTVGDAAALGCWHAVARDVLNCGLY
jgi:hypothetical protein